MPTAAAVFKTMKVSEISDNRENYADLSTEYAQCGQ